MPSKFDKIEMPADEMEELSLDEGMEEDMEMEEDLEEGGEQEAIALLEELGYTVTPPSDDVSDDEEDMDYEEEDEGELV